MSEKEITSNSKLKDVSNSSWEKLKKKKIFFGHQSVGFNILDGIEDLKKEYPNLKLQIINASEPSIVSEGVLLHDRVGKNRQPKSKLDDFSQKLKDGLGERVDVAFMKFCYIDIMPDTDYSAVFNDYKKTIEDLKNAYPNVTFVHITAPLTSRQTGIKAFIKKMLGKSLWGEEDNIVRSKFNELLRKEYSGKDPVFDLAKIESTFPHGSECTFEKEGNVYPCMVPGYSDDGGHLNRLGRRFVAEQLILFLTNI